MRILILGITGMFGSTAFRLLSRRGDHEVFGLARDGGARQWFPDIAADRTLTGIDVTDRDRLTEAITGVRPDVVINAVGIIKQVDAALDPLVAIPINAELPHRLAALCAAIGARPIHVSTDCVFSGRTGNYREEDAPDATDLYGLSKYLGEVDRPHALTLRTSIIGPELATQHGLVEWFLAQRGNAKGYAGAIFSGLTSAELTRVIADVAIPRPALHGLYHVAAAPIAKHDLLHLLREEYDHPVTIERVAEPIIDRSLNGGRFHAATGYVAPYWTDMIRRMRALDERARHGPTE
jgi:dTDP-4-dehydrorhamnose reductase